MLSKFNFNIAQPLNNITGGWGGGGGSAPSDPNTLKKVLDILGSTGGQTAVSAVGAGLQAYDASKQRAQDRAENAANRQQTAAQFGANMLQRQSEDDRAHQLDQARNVASLSPIGESQSFAQRNALSLPLLTGARNFSATPGDPAVAAAMGSTNQGGIRLPEGGFDPSMLNRMFGDATTLESIKNRQQQLGQINPNMNTMDLGSMYGDAGTAATNDIMGGNQQLAQQQADATAKQRDLIMRAIDEDIRGERRGTPPEGYEYDKKTGELKKKGGGFWKTLGKVGLMAAPIVAAPFTGGASLAAIGALSGAASGALNGGGMKGALMGGALGGVTGGLGGGGGASTLSQGLKQAAKNPHLYSAILGGAR